MQKNKIDRIHRHGRPLLALILLLGTVLLGGCLTIHVTPGTSSAEESSPAYSFPEHNSKNSASESSGSAASSHAESRSEDVSKPESVPSSDTSAQESANRISDEEKMQRIERIFELPEECKVPDLLEYAVEKRKEAFLKWDFQDEIPRKCAFIGEIILDFNSENRHYSLFRIEAELKGKTYSFVWWARKETEWDGSHYTLLEYTEAKDTGILWQAPDLDSFYSYYGVADEQAFYDQVLTEDFHVFDFVMYNSVEALDLYKHSYDYWLSLVESRKE